MARLLSVHAHPDDEASKGASTIARLVDLGHQAFLVCATGGEMGDILNPALNTPEIRDNLAQVRAKELAASVEIIGYSEMDWLGYRDSGMFDEQGEVTPDSNCFACADLDEAVGRLVAIIRRLKPHVIITYPDDQQGYRHPDHLRVFDISIPAFERAGDPEWYPEAGEPWQPLKLYYTLWSMARVVALNKAYEKLGIESPFRTNMSERKSLDHRITTKVDISGYYHTRTKALLAHATQVDPAEKFWFGLPDDVAEKAYPYEDYILARSLVESEIPESCLFDGIVDD